MNSDEPPLRSSLYLPRRTSRFGEQTNPEMTKTTRTTTKIIIYSKVQNFMSIHTYKYEVASKKKLSEKNYIFVKNQAVSGSLAECLVCE